MSHIAMFKALICDLSLSVVRVVYSRSDLLGIYLFKFKISVKILKILKQKTVQLSWLVGQSYDGAGNVSGKYSGLKTLIAQQAPRAMYIWCSAHRLNLVIEAVLKCSSDVCNVIGIIQELYNFFIGNKRHSVLVKMQKVAERGSV